MSLDMDWVNAQKARLRPMLRDEYEVRDVAHIPTANQVGLGNKAVKTNVVVLSLDIRDSSALIESHQKKTAGKLHKAFLTCAADAIKEGGGKVRNYTGDGLLAFWPATEQEHIQNAVDVAAFFTDAFNLHINQEFKHYRGIQFGIGIDYGPVHILRAGLGNGQHNSDLVYIGHCINFACRMAKQAKPPHSVRVSGVVRNNLRADQIYDKPEALVFKEQRVDHVWTKHRGQSMASYQKKDSEPQVVWSLW